MLWWTTQQLRSKDWKARESAVRKLGDSQNPRAVESLVAALNDPDLHVRSTAMEGLCKITDTRADELLLVALQDTDSEVQQAAAEGLERRNPDWSKSDDVRRAMPAFILALKYEHSYPHIGKAAAKALELIGSAAVEPLLAALTNENIGARWTLDRIDPNWAKSEAAKRVVPNLLTALAATDWKVRMRAADVLGKIGDSQAVEPLVAAIADTIEEVRRQAAEALGEIGDPRAVEPLRQALAEVPDLRWTAAKALGKISDARAVETLIVALKDGNPDVQKAAAEALERIDPDWSNSEAGKRAALITALADKRADAQASATEALVKMGRPAVEQLLAALKSSNKSVRNAAAVALERIDPCWRKSNAVTQAKLAFIRDLCGENWNLM